MARSKNGRQGVHFTDIDCEDFLVQVVVAGWPGDTIDEKPETAGQVTLNISGPLYRTEGQFETVIDLQLPQARAIAAAILALADYVEKADNTPD